jgi:HORMA domain.
MEIAPTRRQSTTTAPNLTKIIGSFIEVITHEILFTSSLYPFDAFSPTRHYGVTCHACRHPDVVDYIFETLKVAVPGIISGIVDELCIILYDSETDKVLEKYTLEFELDETVNIAEMDSSTHHDQTVSERKVLDEVILNLERSLRDILLRISTLDGTDLGRKRGQKKFSSTATFKICVHTKNLKGRHTTGSNASQDVGEYPELQGAIEEGKWSMADEEYSNFSRNSNNATMHNVNETNVKANEFVMRPLKSVHVPSCGMNIQLLMERLK